MRITSEGDYDDARFFVEDSLVLLAGDVPGGQMNERANEGTNTIHFSRKLYIEDD